MSDQRKHRGPHPQDQGCFADDQIPILRQATADLCWLLTRNYPSASSLKLVGDRYTLRARQRVAIGRCAEAQDRVVRRLRHQLVAGDLPGADLWIDGYNVLTSLEAALSGGVILHARDGCYRDMASMHGSYRKVAETLPALNILGHLLEASQVSHCRWLLDQPVSNSGRLKQIVLELARNRGWSWEVDLVRDPDAILCSCDAVIASADCRILDEALSWFNCARFVIESRIPQAWVIDLSGPSTRAAELA